MSIGIEAMESARRETAERIAVEAKTFTSLTISPE
jgi:hypothetical protein